MKYLDKKKAEEILIENRIVLKDNNGELYFYTDITPNKVIEAMEEYHLFREKEDVRREGKGAEEIYEWLKSQKYQTEQGEQEYKMYFDIDMPKITNDALIYFSLPAKQNVTDEDIEKWANDDIADHWKHGGGAEYDLIYNARIRGAKAHRDGQIPKK